jgi:VWFA-related protein
MMRKFLIFLAAAILFPMGLRAQTGSGSGQATAPKTQTPATQDQSSPRIIVPSRIVVVPVSVKDSRGNLVADLTMSDFRVFQDGVQQQIQRFYADPFPISAVILLDDDLTVRSAEQVQRSLDSIAAGFGSHDEVALVRFDEYPKLALNFTSSNDALFAELKKIRTDPTLALDFRYPGSPSTTMTSPATVNGHPITEEQTIPILGRGTNGVTKHLDDAIYYAARMLRDRPPDRRRIIFVITDGTNDRHNEWSMNNTLHILAENDISVYCIAVGPDILKFGTGRLTHYASATGGDVFFASKQRDLERMYSELADEARNRYTIEFQPTKTLGKGDCHTLEVRVERPNLIVTARQGYCAVFSR